LKSILLGCRFLEKLNLGKLTYLKIYIRNDTAFQVYYNSDKKLPGMFLVKQEHSIFGVDKELTLYYEALTDYFKDIFADYPDMRISKMTLMLGNSEKIFYREKLGVVWREEECAECTLLALKGEKLSKSCKHIIKKKCYEKFRNRPPHFIFKDMHEEIDRKKVDNSQSWECQACLLMNSEKAKKCIACDTKR
jgi:hypothetical protein